MAKTPKFPGTVPKHVDPPDFIKSNYGFIFAMLVFLFVMFILYFFVQNNLRSSNPPPTVNAPAGGL